MQCPKCKLYNPEGAMRCDCGYDFDTGEVKDSYLGPDARTPGSGTVICGWIFSFLGGWIGLIIACTIAFGKTGSVYKYDEKSRRTGKSMLALSIIMMIAWSLLALIRR